MSFVKFIYEYFHDAIVNEIDFFISLFRLFIASVWNFHWYTANFWNSFLSCNSFYVSSSGFPISMITSSAKEDSFPSSFTIWMPSILCLFSLVRNCSTSCSVVSDTLWPHGLQHLRLPCSSPTHRACSNSSIEWVMPSNYLCHSLLLLPWLYSFPNFHLFLLFLFHGMGTTS